jgi:hypothetical protein
VSVPEHHKWKESISILLMFHIKERRSLYSYWLRTGRSRDRSSSPSRMKNLTFSTPRRLSRAHPASDAMGTEGSFTVGQADHSPSTRAEVKRLRTFLYICRQERRTFGDNIRNWHKRLTVDLSRGSYPSRWWRGPSGPHWTQQFTTVTGDRPPCAVHCCTSRYRPIYV